MALNNISEISNDIRIWNIIFVTFQRQIENLQKDRHGTSSGWGKTASHPVDQKLTSCFFFSDIYHKILYYLNAK